MSASKLEIPIDPEVVAHHGLTAEEYRQLCRFLGREPNLTELGIFSVMWSEHCSYKSSRVHLKKLPTAGPQVIQGPGENAGVVDIGNGMAVVFKIESHNHPSFIEPYQGAATGVGGIIRDIFTMGARPIALMNSLHFGPLNILRNQLILEGVVAGIAGYGNCIGIPTVGGEVYFERRYSRNPIVNVFCLGIAPADGIFYARARGVGNPVIYVGAKTGRDGIHGATMASEQFDEELESKRPTVQVGDPFMEKLLLEACLEVMASGAVVGIQDMGAAGLTCSTCEMGTHAGVGIEIELARVPQREPGMTPYEIMLSESQERMLLVAEKGREDEVLSIFKKWDLDAVVIGEVADHGQLVVRADGEIVAQIPNHVLTEEAPTYRRPLQEPAYLEAIGSWQMQDPGEPSDLNSILLEFLNSPHACSRSWIYRQYDHQVGTNTVLLPGHDAAVMRLKHSNRGLAMSLDANPRFCYLSPREGARHAVAESCRNVACTGARPLAATNCLNFASPENPEIMWQFAEVIEGIGEACRKFDTPITGGNVSFYNETRGQGILPTPVIGVVGVMDDVAKACPSAFRSAGDLVFLVGNTGADLGGSVFSELLDLPLAGPCPKIDLQHEKDLQESLIQAIAEGVLRSAHDLSDGGLGMALAESCLGSMLGFEGSLATPLRPDHFLFSETPGRVLVSVEEGKRSQFEARFDELKTTFLGRVVANPTVQLEMNGWLRLDLALRDMEDAWKTALGRLTGAGLD